MWRWLNRAVSSLSAFSQAAVCLWVIILLGSVTSCRSNVPLPPPPPTPAVTTLWIGVTPETAPLGESIVTHFAADGVELHLVTGPLKELATELTNRSLDAIIAHDVPSGETWFNPVAVDGLVLIVHPDNAVTAIDQRQAQQLLSGRLTTWQDVGGANQPPALYVREAGSSGRAMMADLVMGGQPVPVTARTIPSDQQLIAAVAADSHGLGVLWHGQTDGRVRPLMIDGVAPNRFTLANQTYPLPVPIYFIASEEPQGDLRQLLSWLQGEEGQNRLVSEGGYGRVDGR